MKYDWLLFDADHTIFDFDRSAEESLYLTMEEYGMLHNGTEFGLYRRINAQCWHEFELGLISREELTHKRFALFFDETGFKADPLLFHHAYLSKLPERPYLLPGALDLLNALLTSHRLGLITNGLKEVQRPRLEKADMLRYFEVVVISGEVGFQKPDSAYFRLAHEKMGVPPKDRVLVIGDNLHADIKGGLDYGFHTCWFNPDSKEVEDGMEPHYQISNLADLHLHL